MQLRDLYVPQRRIISLTNLGSPERPGSLSFLRVGLLLFNIKIAIPSKIIGVMKNKISYFSFYF